MSDVITFNTEDLAKPIVKNEQPKVFTLVGEDNPILKQVLPEFDFSNPPVNPNAFASTLVETCKLHNGIGLSANQCGFPYRVFVMGAEDNYVAFFNPKITAISVDVVHMVEGCLSFPLLGLNITRPESVQVEYQDFNGVKREIEFHGISARCFQHELDHMNGIVYTEKAKPLALEMGLKKRSKQIKLISKHKEIMIKAGDAK
jgi:peptide deformylase